MDLFEYFEPVSLDKPANIEYLLHQHSFCKHIQIHTPGHKPTGDYKIAIIGVPEYRGSFVQSNSPSIDHIRQQLYQLSFYEKKINIADLGNLKLGKTLTDTYFGLRDLIIELIEKNIFPIIIGGTQDLTIGLHMAFENFKKPYTLTTIDNRIDIAFEKMDQVNFLTYLNNIVLEQNYLFEYINLGHQLCFSIPVAIDLMNNLFYENIRLGILRNQIYLAEPYIRDSHVISIDISAIKNSECGGQIMVSPNGFSAEEICQLTRYAGMSDKLQTIGFFNYLNDNDNNLNGAALIAQAIWYFIEGYVYRLNENPENDNKSFNEYFVTLNDEHQIKFFKSKISNRWWSVVPSKSGKSYYMACSEYDYQNTLRNEIPDRWIKLFKRLN